MPSRWHSRQSPNRLTARQHSMRRPQQVSAARSAVVPQPFTGLLSQLGGCTMLPAGCARTAHLDVVFWDVVF